MITPEQIWAIAGAIAFLITTFQEIRHKYNYGTHMPKKRWKNDR